MGRTKYIETMLTLTSASIVFYLIYDMLWILYTGLFLGVIGLFFKGISMIIANYWMKLAEVLGAIMSRIILSIVFYLILLPVALLYRMANKDPLQLRKKDGSYYHVRDHKYLPQDLEKTW